MHSRAFLCDGKSMLLLQLKSTWLTRPLVSERCVFSVWMNNSPKLEMLISYAASDKKLTAFRTVLTQGGGKGSISVVFQLTLVDHTLERRNSSKLLCPFNRLSINCGTSLPYILCKHPLTDILVK